MSVGGTGLIASAAAAVSALSLGFVLGGAREPARVPVSAAPPVTTSTTAVGQFDTSHDPGKASRQGDLEDEAEVAPEPRGRKRVLDSDDETEVGAASGGPGLRAKMKPLSQRRSQRRGEFVAAEVQVIAAGDGQRSRVLAFRRWFGFEPRRLAAAILLRIEGEASVHGGEIACSSPRIVRGALRDSGI